MRLDYETLASASIGILNTRFARKGIEFALSSRMTLKDTAWHLRQRATRSLLHYEDHLRKNWAIKIEREWSNFENDFFFVQNEIFCETIENLSRNRHKVELNDTSKESFETGTQRFKRNCSAFSKSNLSWINRETMFIISFPNTF